jgi:hypothetical protein
LPKYKTSENWGEDGRTQPPRSLRPADQSPQRHIVMERGEVVLSGDADQMMERDVRRSLTV